MVIEKKGQLEHRNTAEVSRVGPSDVNGIKVGLMATVLVVDDEVHRVD